MFLLFLYFFNPAIQRGPSVFSATVFPSIHDDGVSACTCTVPLSAINFQTFFVHGFVPSALDRHTCHVVVATVFFLKKKVSKTSQS